MATAMVFCNACGLDITGQTGQRTAFCPACGVVASASPPAPEVRRPPAAGSIPVWEDPAAKDDEPLLMLDELASDGATAELGESKRGAKIRRSTDEDSALRIGTRVKVMGKGKGTVRFIGVLHTSTTGEPKVGVELDRPTGKNDGSLGSSTVETVRYFSARLNHGIFVRPTRVTSLAVIAAQPKGLRGLGRRLSAIPAHLTEPVSALARRLTRRLSALPTRTKRMIFSQIATFFLFIGWSVGMVGSCLPRIWSIAGSDDHGATTLTVGIWTNTRCHNSGQLPCTSDYNHGEFSFFGHQDGDPNTPRHICSSNTTAPTVAGTAPMTFHGETAAMQGFATAGILFSTYAVWLVQYESMRFPRLLTPFKMAMASSLCNGAVLGVAASVTANCAFNNTRQNKHTTVQVGNYGISLVAILAALWLNLVGGFIASRRPPG